MNKPLNILMIEDDRADFLLVERHLKQQGLLFNCRCVSSLDALHTAIDAVEWDIVLSDYNLPAMDFEDALAVCRERLPEAPLILVSGSVGEERAVDLLRLGVWDFILKDNLTRLVPSIEHSLREAADNRARRAAENALRESEARLRLFIEHAPAAIAMFDREMRYVSASRRWLIDYHLGDRDLKGLSHYDVFPEIPEYLKEIHRRGLSGETVRAEDDRFERTDGSVQWLRWEMRPWRDHTDDVAGIVIFSEDITERKQAEERIRKLNLVQAALHDPGTLTEKLRRITDGVMDIFNADFARIWLMRPGDLCKAGCVHADPEHGIHACRHREQCLHLMASSGRYTHLDGEMHCRVPFGCYKIGLIASGEETFLTNNVLRDPRIHNPEWAKALGLVSFAGYQLRPPHGETIGVLALFSRHPISSGEDALLKSLSNLVVPVIQTIQAEEAARESEMRLNLALGAAKAGVWDWDLMSDRIIWSETQEALFGYAPGTFPGTVDGFMQRVHPADLQGLRETGERAKTADGSFHDEYRVIWPDNSVHWVASNGRFLFNAQGKAVRVVGVLFDITERKEGEEALRESESRFRLLSKMAGRLLETDNPLSAMDELATQVMDKLACQVFLNYMADDAAGTLQLNTYAGISDEEAREIATLDYGAGICGRAACERVPVIAEDIAAVDGPMTALIKPFGLTAYACHPLIAAGEVIGTLSFGTKTKDRFSPQDLELMKMVTDQLAIASERTRIIKALRESEDRFRALFEQAAVGVAQIETPTGRFVTINNRYCSIVGYTREEMLSRTFQELTHPDDLQADWDSMSRLCRDEIREFSREKRYYHKNGSVVWVNLSVSPLWRPGEKPGFHVAVVEDITERKRAAQEKERLESQLRQAQKLEAIGTLAGGVAHDFNNILSAIIGYTELAQEYAQAGTPQHDDLRQVLQASNRAKDLVSQILTFSRRRDSQEFRPISLGLIIKEALKLLRPGLPSTIQIQSKISPDTGTITGDPSQLHQVIMNLCTNAAHAMRSQGGVLELDLCNAELDVETRQRHDVPQDRTYIRLRVRDSGHGMDAATLERIFDPYFTTKGSGEGTGLGLAVVHGIVKNHGGTIAVQSTPGTGTLFEILFPQTKPLGGEAAPSHGRIPTGSERILFVDDEEALAELGQRMLFRLGYHTTIRTSSTEALKLFRSDPQAFDLVITDYTMPRMTGAALALELRKVRKDIPLILCSGYSEMISEEKAKEMGINAFVMKPISSRSIAEAIRKVLD